MESILVIMNHPDQDSDPTCIHSGFPPLKISALGRIKIFQRKISNFVSKNFVLYLLWTFWLDLASIDILNGEMSE